MSDKNETTTPTNAVAVPVNQGFFTLDKAPPRADANGKPVPAGPPQQTAGWVGIRTSKTGNVEPERALELDEAGIEVGDAYLTVDGVPLKINPFNFHLLKVERLWTELNPRGSMVDASATAPADPKASKLKEVLYCVLAVQLPGGGYKAATAKFRGAAARGIQYVQNAMEKAMANPQGYAALSPKHKRALDAAQSLPNGAGVIISKLWGTEEEGANGDYLLTHTKSYPNPDPDAFNRWYHTAMQPGGELQSAARFHNKNVGEVRDLIAGKGKPATAANTAAKK